MSVTLKKIDLKKLSNTELKKVQETAADELKRRNQMQGLETKIARLILKHGCSFHDIDWESIKIFLKKQAAVKSSSQRASVKPKYADPNRANFWSGRGRAPKWVVDLCEKERLNIVEFKSTEKYLVKEEG